jgi:putative ABC transport system permease protein
MQTLWQDIRHSFRVLAKGRGTTALAVITLMLGIGACSAILTLIRSVVLNPLPYRQPSQLVRLYESLPQFGWNNFTFSWPDYIDFRERNHSFQAVGAYVPGTFNLALKDHPEIAKGARVTSSFFDAIGVTPERGRTFSSSEDTGRGADVVVLSDSLWRRLFAHDAEVVGKTVTIDDRPTTIVGVMPPDFELHNQEEIWLTLGPLRGDNGRGNHGITVIGRLKTGVPLTAAMEDAKSVAGRLEKEFPGSNEGEGIVLVSFTDWLVTKDFRRALWLLSGAVAFLLLITCSNIANLLLARSTQRRTEMAIRSALGATSSRLMRQLLTESAMLSGVGGVLGAFAGAWLIYALKLFGSTRIPRLQQVSPDVGVFAVTIALALICGLIFGLAPALRVARADVNSDLKQSGRTGSAARAKDYLRSLLVVSEVTLSFILLAGAGLLMHSYWLAVNVSPGFNAQNLLTARFSLPRSRYLDPANPAKAVTMLERVQDRVRGIPGVERVGFTDYAPFHDSNPSMEVHLDGEAQSANHAPASSGYRDVSAGYLETLGVPLLSGRTFSADDTSTAPRVAVVSRAFAERFFPDGAIGKVFHPGDPKEKPVSIIGVVGDAAHFNIEEPVGPMFYLSAMQNQWFQAATFVVRSSAPNDQIANGMREALRAEDPALALFGVQQMDELIATSFTGRKFNLLLLGSFAGLALLLAVGGIFGVVSYSVTQRTQEIGIRMSVGAEPSDILRLMVGQGMLPVTVGLALGILGALSLTRLMSSLLYAIPAHDPFTYVAVSVIFVTAAFLACALPAYRAAHIDPMVALRRD